MVATLLAALSLHVHAYSEDPWNPVNLDAVSGSHLSDKGVWIAHKDMPSYSACQALCAANASCVSVDWAGDVDLGPKGSVCFPKRYCYFRSDNFYRPHLNGKCNHTCGHKPGAPGPSPGPMCGGEPAKICHSDADCEAAPSNCSWCRSPAPGKLNIQTCGPPPSPGDCGNVPGSTPSNASTTQYMSVGDSVSKGIFGKLGQMLTAAPFWWEIFHPASNDGGGCGNTVRGRDCTDFWLEGANRSDGREWNVITFNYGLHDLANDSEFVSLGVYQDNLRNITARLLDDAPGLRQLYWLSSTPVPDCTLSPPRAQSDVPKYNAAALEVMKEPAFVGKVKIIDLYAFVIKQCGGDPHYKSCAPFQDAAGVHFGKQGYVAMATYIKDAITKGRE